MSNNKKTPNITELGRLIYQLETALEDISQLIQYPADSSKVINWNNVSGMMKNEDLINKFLDEILHTANYAEAKAGFLHNDYREWYREIRESAGKELAEKETESLNYFYELENKDDPDGAREWIILDSLDKLPFFQILHPNLQISSAQEYRREKIRRKQKNNEIRRRFDENDK